MRRTLFRMRLPFALFIIIIAVVCLASFAIFYNVFVAYDRGDCFMLETEYLDVDFPKNWFAIPWEEKNVSGGRYGLLLSPPDLRAGMFITIYDEKAAKTYLKQNNVTDAFSVNMFEMERLYNLSLQKSENATVYFIENGTRIVSGYTTYFSTFVIKEGYIDEYGEAYNLTWTLMSSVGDKMFQILYYGIGEDYDSAYEKFQFILNSTRIKE